MSGSEDMADTGQSNAVSAPAFVLKVLLLLMLLLMLLLRRRRGGNTPLSTLLPLNAHIYMYTALKK